MKIVRNEMKILHPRSVSLYRYRVRFSVPAGCGEGEDGRLRLLKDLFRHNTSCLCGLENLLLIVARFHSSTESLTPVGESLTQSSSFHQLYRGIMRLQSLNGYRKL